MQAGTLKKWAITATALVALAMPAAAQTPIQVHDAEMAVPFGADQVRLVVVGDRLIVVGQGSDGFAIDRSNVARVSRDGASVLVELTRPVDGRSEIRLRLDDAESVVRWSDGGGSAPRTTGAPVRGLTLQVKHDHMMLRGSCVGQLMIDGDRIAFESLSDVDHSRQWFYRDLREVKQDGIYKLEITPFLDNNYNFELSGRGLNSQEYRDIVNRVAAARSR